MELYLINLATCQAAQVTNDVAVHSDIAWSPKGDMLAFKSRDDNGNVERAFVLKGG